MTSELPHDPLPPAPRGAGPAPSDEIERRLDDPRALQILTAEHAALSSARSLVYNEAFTRAGMFLTFLSASLVALALVGQAMAFSRQFLGLAATLLLFDTFIGVATVGRILEAQIADLRFIHGMNRIRAGYVQIVPAVAPFLAGSIHDDIAGVFENYGATQTRSGPRGIFHGLSTTGGMTATIVASLAAAIGAVVGLLADRGTAVVVGGGIGGFAIVFVALVRYGMQTVRSFEEELTGPTASRPAG